MLGGKLTFACLALLGCLIIAEITEGKYLGCFVDKRHIAIRGYRVHKNRALTVEQCIKKCKSKKFLYAGLQSGDICDCGNSYDRYGKAPESQCRMKCRGNPDERCGGSWRNSVYETGVKPMRKKYIGCFKDAGNRAIRGVAKYNDKTLSIDKCVRLCHGQGYMYAGVQYSTACFCGNSFSKYGPGTARSCRMKCSGNYRETCGGPWRNSVYSTGIKHRKYTYIGCFIDKGKRAIVGFHRGNSPSMSIPSCVKLCQSKNFLFAGLQYSKWCFCGNEYGKYGKGTEKSCSMKCSGNHKEICGGPWRNSVYATGIKTKGRRYIGCYKDETNRAMNGFIQLNNKLLSQEGCIHTCKGMNFPYAGMQFKTACFCGNSYDKYGKASDRDCSMTCSGNPTEICGGPWRNTVFATGIKVKEWTYLGCYKDARKRDLTGYALYNDKKLTLEGCIVKCQSLRFLYAAVQYSTACFCSNSYGKYGKDHQKTCSMKCSGNRDEFCGGPWRNSVFATGIKTPNRKYMGCFKDAANRAIRGKEIYNSQQLSIEECIRTCSKYNFKYAGLQFSTACFCGNHYQKYGRAKSGDCSMKCKGNPSEICGGPWANSVWATGAEDTKWKYIGCYKDSGRRAMKDVAKYNDKRLTIRKCVQYCALLNYLYAGVQYSTACFCSNSYHRYGKARDRDCSMPCSGDRGEKCGGRWRNSVFSTEIKTKARKYMGCFKDKSVRAIKGFKQIKNYEVSTESCIRRCRLLNFKYAGLQYGSQCFCDNEYDRYGELDESMCSMRCSGNRHEKCGGPWANSVYMTGLQHVKPWHYIGCYKDSGHRAIKGFIVASDPLMTTDRCIKTCASKHLLYAGIQARTWCFCGNSYDKYGMGDEKTCSMKCPGNHAELCGGSWRNSVFSTGVREIEKRYIGCFVDKRQRAMDGYKRIRNSALSVESCIRRCASLNYPYAGLQYGTQCYCDHVYAIYGRGDERTCNKKCSGNHAEICGGSWRNSVYSTGLPVLASSPTVKIETRNGIFRVVCNFPPIKDHKVMYVITFHFGSRKVIKKVMGKESSVALTPDEMPSMKMGQTIYVELSTCLRKRCDSTMSKPFQSNVIETDMGIPDFVTVTEGKSAFGIKIKPSLPPVYWCGKHDCKITVFSEFLHADDLKCFGTTVYQAVVAKEADVPCGIEFSADNWNVEQTISLHATDDGLVDKTMVRYLKIFAEYKNADGSTTTVTLKIVKVKVKDVYKGSSIAICNSVNDPHMKTFDNKYYNNYYQGDFILYRHKKISQEFQIFYRSCNGRASCNCALAARAEDDVIIIDSCGPKKGVKARRPVEVKAFVNGKMTEGFEIRRFASGMEYHIYLPTGTYAIVKVGSTFLNVWVKASAADVGQTEGLCGSLDSNMNNDFMMRDAKTGEVLRRARSANEFSLSWRPRKEEKLYAGYCSKPSKKAFVPKKKKVPTATLR